MYQCSNLLVLSKHNVMYSIIFLVDFNMCLNQYNMWFVSHV